MGGRGKVKRMRRELREGVGEKLTHKEENWEKKCPAVQNPHRRGTWDHSMRQGQPYASAELKVRGRHLHHTKDIGHKCRAAPQGGLFVSFFFFGPTYALFKRNLLQYV